jgi:hypothetical protein
MAPGACNHDERPKQKLQTYKNISCFFLNYLFFLIFILKKYWSLKKFLYLILLPTFLPLGLYRCRAVAPVVPPPSIAPQMGYLTTVLQWHVTLITVVEQTVDGKKWSVTSALRIGLRLCGVVNSNRMNITLSAAQVYVRDGWSGECARRNEPN